VLALESWRLPREGPQRGPSTSERPLTLGGASQRPLPDGSPKYNCEAPCLIFKRK